MSWILLHGEEKDVIFLPILC